MTDRRTNGAGCFRLGLYLATAFAALAPANGFAQEGDLAEGFKNPPQSARPRVWWHWMNGNVTVDGIAKDLDWMKRVGIGGVQNFDANLATPPVVDTRLIYMDPAWKKAFRFAVNEADRLGLEFAIAASPGWSETGGPWVKPEDALKKLVWSETEMVGGRRFAGRLAAPPSVTGPFQAQPFGRRGSVSAPVLAEARPTLYADIAVLAYPMPQTATSMAVPTVLGRDDTPIDGAALLDDDPTSSLDATPNGDDPARFTYVYAQPRTIRSADVFVPGARGTFGLLAIEPVLEASDDGRTWRPVASIELAQVRTTVSFAPVTARRFRLTLRRNLRGVDTTRDIAKGLIRPNPTNIVAGRGTEPVRLAQFHLSGEDKVNQAEAKAGFSLAADYFRLDGPGVGEARGADPATVVDLTGRMKPDGTLDWTPPKGRWRVVRLGASLIGTTNHPATPEATGLEVDKFDGDAVRRYIDHYLGMYRDTVGDGLIGKRGVRALLTDSIEVGAANWTPRMLAQFRRLRGYDPLPWMPVLTGALIGSRADSDRFLYDWRRTLADLMSSEHYGTIAKAAHDAGMLVYGEALEDNRPSLGDDMTMRSHADVPMAAMWTFSRAAGGRPTYVADIRGAASVAHIYGQNLVAAESMTSAQAPWAHAPSDLRRVVDLEFAHGVNRPVIHTSVHQPVDDKVPGLSLSAFGQFFNRHESWAESARPWVDYLSRNSFLLQQGVNVADVAYFYGEEAPLTGLYGGGLVPDAPTRYAYDFISADALASQVAVRDGQLVARGGASYRVLYLGGSSRQMTLATLRRIAAFVEAGGTVVGEAPTASPALTDDRAAFAALTRRLWGGGAQGRGRIIAGSDVEAALGSVGVVPDFAFARPSAESQVLFVHRRTPDADIYYVNNRLNRAETIEARFRITGKAPEIWRADTGAIVPTSYRTEGEQTVVPLAFGPEDSYFVVFRRPASGPSVEMPNHTPRTVATLSGGWTVRFQPGRGAPTETMPLTLGSWTDRTEPGIRYFSGRATYTTTFRLPARAGAGAGAGEALMLDLGQVGDLATVRVNGSAVGTAWHAPYRLDIGKAARAGRNTLEVDVVNLWVNRLIGDAQPGAKQITWTAVPTYRADAPLRPSGLIGPVVVSSR